MFNPSNADIRKSRGLKVECDEYFYLRGHLDFIYLVTDRRIQADGITTILRGYNSKVGELLANEANVIFIADLN
jgi:hypothetical protein